MISSHKIALLILLFFVSLSTIGQDVDLTEIPLKYHDAILNASRGIDVDMDISNALFLTEPTCNTGTDGQLCLDTTLIVGGVGPYSISFWTGGPTPGVSDSCYSNVGAGTYGVLITDLGQETTSFFEIDLNEPQAIFVFEWNASPPSCFDLCDGAANPLVLGGAGGITYSYNNGPFVADPARNDLCNPFTLTLKDLDGCLVDTTFNFENGALEIVVDSIVKNACFGQNDGFINLTISGGDPYLPPNEPYQYSWTGPNGYVNNTPSISNLMAGTYTITITDQSPCSISKTYEITQTPPIVFDPVINPIFCYGDTDGEISPNVAGGTPPYNYQWTGSNVLPNGENQTNLPAGTYNLVVTDSIACTATESFTIATPDSMNITGNITPVSCFGENDGAISLTITGDPQFYSWDVPACYTGPTNTRDLTNLCGGIYEITVTDVAGCSISATFEVMEPSEIILELSKTDVSCFGQNDGAISLNIVGGAQPTTIPTWSPLPYTVDGNGLINLGPNDYTVEYTDNNGCFATASITVNEQAEITVSETITDATCSNLSDGSIFINITGGVGNYNITWKDELEQEIGNGLTLQSLSPGVYSLTIVDATGCSFTNTYTVSAPDEILINIASITPILCSEDANGAIDIEVTGGDNNFTYAWTGTPFIPNPSNQQDVNNLPAGTYSVLVASGACTAFEVITINPTTPMALDFDVTPLTCAGLEDGAIDMTITGGALPIQLIEWTGGITSNDEDITGLGADTYFVSVTDDHNCAQSGIVTLDPLDPVVITGNTTMVTCFEGSTGAIDILIPGNPQNTSFAWTGPDLFEASTEDLNNIAAGTYDVVATLDGCPTTASFEVTQSDSIYVEAVVIPFPCNGNVLGSIDITPHGGAGGYTFFWSGPGISAVESILEDQENLVAGSYQVIVTDESLCFKTFQFELTPTTSLVINGVSQDVSCFGLDNGSITTNPAGGVSPYTYDWSGTNLYSNNTQNINNLPQGDYSLLVSDINGCVKDTLIHIGEPNEIVITVNKTDPTCGNNNGNITVNTLGGVGVTNVTVTLNGLPINDLNNLSAGVYIITATDSNGCTATETVTLSNAEISISGNVVNNNCFAGAMGSIDISYSGAVGATTVSWIGDGPIGTPNQEQITNLIAGEYIVTVADASGCEASEIFEITQNDEIIVDVDVVNVFCENDNNGSISVVETIGGTGGYTYVWNSDIHDGFESSVINNLSSGFYVLTVSDSQGCSIENTYEINGSISISIDALITDVACFGDETGAIDITVNGGTPSYTYAWSNAMNSEDLTNISAGNYLLSVEDENNCISDTTFTVGSSTELFGSAVVSNISCFGLTDGSITLVDLGGSDPYSFNWSSNAVNTTDQNVSNLPTGTIDLSIVDDNQCAFDTTFTITEPTQIEVEADVTHVVCYGASTGSINVTNITGGTGDVTLSWNPIPEGASVVGNSLIDIPAGNYEMMATDENGCVITQSYTVLNTNTEIISTVQLTDVFCAGQNEGEILLTIIGGIPGYDVLWTGTNIVNPTQFNQTNLAPGTYNLTITDNLQCTVDTSFVINQTNPIGLDIISVQHNACFEDGVGSIDIEINGGSPEYSYTWTSNNGLFENSQDISELSGGVYNIHVVDINQCELDQEFVIEEPMEITYDLAVINSNCGLDDGSATVSNINGGTTSGNYTINWYNSLHIAIGTSDNIVGLSPGLYSLEIMDDNACVKVEEFTISDNVGDIATLINPLNCFNDSNGSIEVSVSGFTRPITFDWSSPLNYTSSDSIITNLSADTYTITITDNLGCQIVESYPLINPPELLVQAQVLNESCPAESDGSINLSVTGGTGNYTFEWTGVGITQPQSQDQIDLPPNTYSVTIMDDNSCSITKEYTILPANDFSIEAEINQISCHGETDASILLNLVFDNNIPIENITYTWTGPNIIQGNPNQFDLGVGEYTVIATTPNGCTHTATYNISESTEILINVTVESSTCLMNNGSASVTAIGGNVANDYTYEWKEGSGNTLPDTDNILGNIGAGIYQINVTDDVGCTITENFVVSDLGGNLSYIVDNVSCPGLSDGAIDITFTGMSSPVGILWTGPDGNYNPTDEDITGLQQGEYIVMITANDGCILGDVIPVEEQDEITSYADITNVTCFQMNNGAIDITITGGMAPYNITWTDGDGNIVPSDANGDLSSLSIGDYTVQIVDGNLCTGTAIYSITQPEEIKVISNITQATCFGYNDGSIDVLNVSGGTTPYTFSWVLDGNPSFGSSFQSIDALIAGTYNLTIVDDNNCTFTESFEITNNDQITSEITVSAANCGLPTGEAIIVANGGNNNYSYQWYNSDDFLLNESSNHITGLVQGSYYVVVIDGFGCSNSFDFEIQNEDYTVSHSIVNNSCFGDTNGSITITLSDDFSLPIQNLTWSGPMDNIPSETTINNLVFGDYTLTLSDANGCPFEDTYTVAQPDSISISTITANLNCFEDQTGSIVLSTSGGTPYQSTNPEYTYNWTVPAGVADPGNTHFYNNLAIGDYAVLVTDSLGCNQSYATTITQPDPLDVFAVIQNVICESDANGSIQVIASGGTVTDDYNYQWTNNETTSEINNITAGTYGLSITDDNGCQLDSTFEITASIVIDLQFATTPITCHNDGDGAIDLTATGGSDQFDIVWNASNDGNIVDITTEDINTLTGGDYYLYLTDVINGCIKQDTIQLINPDSLLAITNVINPLCFNDDNGAIEVTTQGGTEPYQFTWVSPDIVAFSESTDSIENLSPATYNLEIIDNHLCTNQYSFEVEQPEPLALVVDSISNAFCYTSEDGSVYSTVTGGQPNYTIQWTNNQGAEYTGSIIQNVLPGVYNVEIVDNNNCVINESVLLPYDEEVLAIIKEQIPACDQMNIELDGTASVNANTYTWYDVADDMIGETPMVPVTLNLDYDQFVLMVSNGVCVHTDTLNLVVHPLPSVDAGVDQEAFQDEEVLIGGNPSGPTAVAFQWSPGVLLSDSTASNPTYYNIGSQQFFLTVTDINGCENTDSTEVILVNQVIIPDGFSPNGDGKNDTWNIANSSKFPDMVVKIYNRWGDKLFESKGYAQSWDGQYNNTNVPVGTYYYVIELHDPLFPNPFTGPLTIFR